jgi:hypothetical protein
LGGPVLVVEPASVLDARLIPVRNFPDAPLMRETASGAQLAALPVLRDYELRDPTIIERITALNPLRDRAPTAEQPAN